MKIAIYGKGGIGKSTIASNISVCMAENNKKVLQIGCDPKHDSTLLFLKKGLNTVLDIVTSGNNFDSEDIYQTGKYGIDCIEIGGPSPGVGCAGRGIIKGLEIIEYLGFFSSNNYDLTLFDVLGDVVCGGFFEPLKRNRVNDMYIITSGEFNSLFAANNICSGYMNCRLSERNINLVGVIGNYRGVSNEESIVRTFCKTTNLRLIAEIHRDSYIEECTSKGLPFFDKNNLSESAKQIKKICDFIEQPKILQIPTPLSLEELRKIVLYEF